LIAFLALLKNRCNLFAALLAKRSLADLSIGEIHNLITAAFGSCLSVLLRNNDTLQRLELRLPYFEATPFDADLARSLQPVLLSNQTLKHFDLVFATFMMKILAVLLMLLSETRLWNH
jgi:hypothetical protein